MTNKTSGFRLYLQVRIGKALRTDEAFLTTHLDGREVRISASLGFVDFKSGVARLRSAWVPHRIGSAYFR